MLEPSHIRDEWHWVTEGLDAVRDKCPQVPWRNEDVYADCIYDKAFLYVDKSEPGFVILKPQTCMYTGKRSLLVWIAYGRGFDMIERHQAKVDEIARSNGFTTLEFRSPRKGFQKIEGWQMRTAIYERQL